MGDAAVHKVEDVHCDHLTTISERLDVLISTFNKKKARLQADLDALKFQLAETAKQRDEFQQKAEDLVEELKASAKMETEMKAVQNKFDLQSKLIDSMQQHLAVVEEGKCLTEEKMKQQFDFEKNAIMEKFGRKFACLQKTIEEREADILALQNFDISTPETDSLKAEIAALKNEMEYRVDANQKQFEQELQLAQERIAAMENKALEDERRIQEEQSLVEDLQQDVCNLQNTNRRCLKLVDDSRDHTEELQQTLDATLEENKLMKTNLRMMSLMGPDEVVAAVTLLVRDIASNGTVTREISAPAPVDKKLVDEHWQLSLENQRLAQEICYLKAHADAANERHQKALDDKSLEAQSCLLKYSACKSQYDRLFEMVTQMMTVVPQEDADAVVDAVVEDHKEEKEEEEIQQIKEVDDIVDIDVEDAVANEDSDSDYIVI